MTLSMGPVTPTIPTATTTAAPPTGGSFSWAMAWALGELAQVRRAGWAAGISVCLIRGAKAAYTVTDAAGGRTLVTAPLTQFLAIRTPAGVLAPWTPTVGDYMATDWEPL